MKNTLLAALLSCSFLSFPIITGTVEDSASLTRTAIRTSSQRLDEVRADIKATINDVQEILDKLCLSLQHVLGDPADIICQQLSLLATCTQTISSRIPDMNERELAHLLDINTTLMANIEQHIIDQDYDEVGNFETASIYTALNQENSHFVTIEQLEKKLARLKEKISIVYQMVNDLEIAVIEEEASCGTCSSIIHNVANHKGTLIAGGLCGGLAYLLRNQSPSVIIKEMIARLPIYTLVCLYVLRQKKDGDIKRWANDSFGADSFLTKAILAIKQGVGSPREKRPGVHIIARADMTAEEQIAWAEANNCEPIKVDYKKRSIPWLGTFFDLDDSLFKWSFSWIFAQQLRADVLALSKLMGEGAEDVVKKILNPGK